ncbi:FlhB HrpN YscU SpaS Family [Treponema bryantii]|uniref:FlhB HrpN YscU SpaS Family n=1 Tax=Treponema bryantii TaxID=163 RepID=A0A1I3LJ61_9SPIR|nr:EscU/YscU/HrcU family type III secretion system export apparatus switch protein [Treponema bryantii]SFI84788.1 FlhB HrpN YscU SpaS Family [Treponema bryantii]
MEKKTKTPERHFYNLLSAIGQSDVIIRDESNRFLGLYYDSKKKEAPYVICKESGTLSNCLYKYLKTADVLCVDDSLLTENLYDNFKEGEFITDAFYNWVAKIYADLRKYKDETKEPFHKRLNNDLTNQINLTEKKIYNRALKRFRKNELKYSNNKSCDVERILEEGFTAIPEFYKLKYEKSYNEKYEVAEYCLGTEVSNYNIEFCLFIFVSKKEDAIYVCTPAFTESFKIDEAGWALGLVGELTKTITHELIRSTEKYCREFEINLRLYEKAYTSMKNLLETNYQKTGIEYGLKSDTTVFEVYLRKQDKNSSMFFIVITCNEFLRDPEAFKKFISAPYKMRRWNFWCRERKYDQKKFDEKFQPEIS